MNIEVFGVLLAGFLTLCIYSFLYRDNPLYRFAEYLFVGVSAGYTLSRAFHDVFDKLIWGPLVDPAPGATTDWAILIPVILGIFLILKLVPQVSWLSRWALAFVVGGTIGLSMTSRFKSDVMEQIKATIAPFAATEMSASELHSRAIYLGEDLKAESNYEGVNEFYQFYYRYLMVELRGKTSLSGSSLDRFKELNALEQEILKSEKEMLGELIHWLDSSQKEMVEAGDFFRTEVTRLENDLAEYMVNGAEGSSRRETINGLYEISEALQLKGIDEAMYQQSFESIKVLAAALKNSHVNYLKGDQSPNAGLDLTAWKDLQKERWLFFAEYTKALKDLGVQSEALLGLIDGKFASTESTEAGLVALVGMKNQVNRRVALLGTLLQADLTQPAPGRWKELLYGFIIAVISLTILIYFFFSTEHTGVVGVSATFGIYFLMICFGSSFGFTIMARISLLIGRVSFLIGKFWDTLVKLFTGGG